MTLLELIKRIQFEANNLPNANPSLTEKSVLIEILLPRVMSVVASNATKDENQLAALRQDHVLTFASGVATLPESIKEEFAPTIYVVNATAGAFSNASYKKQFIDYATGTNNVCAKFTVQNRQMLYRNGGQPSGTFAGNLTINAITLPTLPSAISDTVVLKDNLLEQVITTTVAVITGQISLAAIGLDYAQMPSPKQKKEG